ncbi:hypothetical protein LTSERUB_0469, partial [Salmonella enterica subsp. enterica serovar Rubislaw str. A4-653]
GESGREPPAQYVDDFEPEALATKPVKLPEKVRKVEAA